MKNGRRNNHFMIVTRDEIAGLPIPVKARVLSVLRTFAWRGRGVTSNSHSEIAGLVGTARRNVPRVIRRLEADGALTVVRGYPRGHTANTYRLPYVAEDEATDAAGESVLNPETRSVLNPEDPIEIRETREILSDRGERARGARTPSTKKTISAPVAGRQGALLLP